MTEKCTQCPLAKLKSEVILDNNNSAFDAASDQIHFEQVCASYCIFDKLLPHIENN